MNIESIPGFFLILEKENKLFFLKKILNCVKDFRLKLIEQLWKSFWQKNNVYDADIEQCQQRGINEENSVEL